MKKSQPTSFARYLLKLKQAIGLEPRFLCDKCAYDYDGACYNPKRPNATYCEEYKRRGK